LITGLLIVDNEDNVYFDLPSVVTSKKLSHYEYFKGISEEHVVLYGRTAWKSLEEYSPHETAVVEVNKTLAEVQRKYPYRPILVVGNHKIIRNLKYLDRVIIVKYHIKGSIIDTCPNTKWIEPDCAAKRQITLNPWYTITQCDLEKCDSCQLA
jgi:hypothetical protein